MERCFYHPACLNFDRVVRTKKQALGSSPAQKDCNAVSCDSAVVFDGVAAGAAAPGLR